MARSEGSLNIPLTSWMPSGRPDPESPHGTVIDGSPLSDHGTWNRGSPVGMPSGAGAGAGQAGDRRRCDAHNLVRRALKEAIPQNADARGVPARDGFEVVGHRGARRAWIVAIVSRRDLEPQRDVLHAPGHEADVI